jgi:hypothetical protein
MPDLGGRVCRWTLSFTFALALLEGGHRATADLVISVQSGKVIPVGSGTATLDVTIQGEPLSSFTAALLLSDGVTHLEFLSQLDPGHGPTLDAANYVLRGKSAAISASDPTFASGFGSATTGTGGYLTVFTGSDFTEDFSDDPIGPSNNLLARLSLNVPTLLSSPTGTDTFVLSLDTAGSHFYTAIGDEISINQAQSQLSGTIFVTSSVPEPSGLVLALTALLAAGLVAWLRSACS